MSDSILFRASPRSIFRTTASALGVLVMTSVHHIYGAVIFDTPWRLHIVFVSIPVALIILGAIPLGRTAGGLPSRLASWTYVALVGIFAIAMIGIYEGGYNHLLPNIQYVLGVDHPLREGLYEPPDDLAFQLTGIAQFVVAIIAAWELWRLISSRGQLRSALAR
jgi:hypothetical protein